MHFCKKVPSFTFVCLYYILTILLTLRTSDVVKDPKPRNPRGTTSTFKSPTRTRPRKLIPEQNPKPDIQTPKPRKPLKVLNLYIKYLKITIKINKKNFQNFFSKSIIYFSSFLPLKVKKLTHIFLWKFFFKQKSQKITFN